MSVAEQAIADSRRILEADLLDIFFPDAGGNVLAASNADFYNAFLNLVGGGEPSLFRYASPPPTRFKNAL